MAEEQVTQGQVVEETPVASETVESQKTAETTPPATVEKVFPASERVAMHKTMTAKDGEISTLKSQLSVLLNQGKSIETLVGKIERLEEQNAEMLDRFDGVSQTTEAETPAVQSAMARLKAEREAARAKTQPQPMTEADRAAETIKSLLSKAKINQDDPILESVRETWNTGDYIGAVEDVRMITSKVSDVAKALEEEGLSLSSDEAKKVREALKTGNTRKINRAVEDLIEKKVEADNAKVEAENTRKGEFKILAKSPGGSVSLGTITREQLKDPEFWDKNKEAILKAQADGKLRIKE